MLPMIFMTCTLVYISLDRCALFGMWHCHGWCIFAGAVAIMGHSWPGEIQKLDSLVHQRLHGGRRGVRYHKWGHEGVTCYNVSRSRLLLYLAMSHLLLYLAVVKTSSVLWCLVYGGAGGCLWLRCVGTRQGLPDHSIATILVAPILDIVNYCRKPNYHS